MSLPKSPVARSLWYDAWRRLKRNRPALVAGGLIFGLSVVAIFADYFAPYPFDLQNMDRIMNGPSWQHWFGTDSLGRDLLSRVIFGARTSMTVGIVASLLSLILGTIYGATSGWLGGRADSLMMRAIDILNSIPTLVLMILVKVVFDSVALFEHPEIKAVSGMLLALSLVGWVDLARVVRGQVLQVKEMTFVEASRSLGASGFSILVRHVLPNILGPIIVLLTYLIPSNILFESFLSFIGLGLQPPYSSWGVLASEGAEVLRSHPHAIIFPGVALFVAMISFQFLGDGLRDALDPKMRNRM